MPAIAAITLREIAEKILRRAARRIGPPHFPVAGLVADLPPLVALDHDVIAGVAYSIHNVPGLAPTTAAVHIEGWILLYII